MRFIKMFGLAAIAVGAAMAFVGTGAAMAESTSVTPTALHATASNPLLHTSLGNVKCTSSLVKASVLELGSPQVAHLEELTWSGCKTHSGFNCTVETVLFGLFNVLRLSSSDAHSTSTGGTVVHVTCPFVNCYYGGEPTLLGLAQNLPETAGTLHANTVVTRTDNANHNSSVCPETSTWLALYESLADVTIGT